MSQPGQSIVRQAQEQFRKGSYHQAMKHYQLAAREYGHHLFANNIRLCELRIARSGADQSTAAVGAQGTPLDSNVTSQLADTQQLLEHYFIRCQELENQLMDRESLA